MRIVYSCRKSFVVGLTPGSSLLKRKHVKREMVYPFRNLIFEGGGVKGIAYIGAMQVLQTRGILGSITRVGGTSAGAINALLFALNYSIDETQEILWKLNFNDFRDSSWFWPSNAVQLFRKYGWYRGEFFRQWIGLNR